MNVRDVRGIAAFALAAALATAGCAHSGETPAWKTLPKPAALPMPDESGLALGNVLQLDHRHLRPAGRFTRCRPHSSPTHSTTLAS
jgi:hypothetical protein